MTQVPNLRTAVSHTTRPPRGQEQDGVQYHFVSKETFQEMITADKFAEWTQIHSNFYGTSHQEIVEAEQQNVGLILEIEGHGALQIKGKYPRAATIFILPPSIDELRARMVHRGENTPDEIERRIQNAIAEIQYVEQFDYVVINDDFETAVSQIESIISAERLRKHLVWPRISSRFKG